MVESNSVAHGDVDGEVWTVHVTASWQPLPLASSVYRYDTVFCDEPTRLVSEIAYV